MTTRPSLPLPPAALDALGLDGPVAVERGGVARIETPVGVVWAKTVEPPRRNVNAAILPVLARLMPLPILRRGTAGKGGDTLLRQAERLRDLAARGVPVARVIHADRDVLITADGGPTLEGAVRDSRRRERRGLNDADLRTALLAMTRALAGLHRHGTAHGRPKIRDFAWDGARVTILDLEERPWEVMPMADAQARDAFIWVHDLCGLPFSRALAPEAATILWEALDDEARASLRRLMRLMRRGRGPARAMLRLLPGNRELVAGLAAYDVLRETVSRE